MFEKIIDSFEKLCVQIIIEILLVPVTIYKLFRKSTRCYDYVVAEMARDEGRRFEDVLSPIKLSVYTSVLISILMIDAGGQTSFLSRIQGLSMVEKALIIFMVNNLTAILFSLLLLCVKRGKINSPEYRTLLFSFVYTSVYTSVPIFFLITSLMAIGQTMDAASFITELSRQINDYGLGKLFLLLSVILIAFLLGLVGLYKTFLSYRHILQANWSRRTDVPEPGRCRRNEHPETTSTWQNRHMPTLIAFLMFLLQLIFVSKVL